MVPIEVFAVVLWAGFVFVGLSREFPRELGATMGFVAMMLVLDLADEYGSPLVTAALHSDDDIHVVGQNLHVTVAAQSSPPRPRAIAELCRLLNDTTTRFPGTGLTLRYSVVGVPDRAS